MGLSKAEKEHAAWCALEERKTYPPLGELQFADPRAKEYMEIVRKTLSAMGMAVTVIGPYVALRFSSPKNPDGVVTVSLNGVDIHDTGVFELEDDK